MRQAIKTFNRRRKLIIASIIMGSLGMVPVIVLGGYQAIQVVDSSAFCTSCHDVHYVEAVTVNSSAHSMVTCSECHIGEGTKNLVLSKIKGASELLPTLTNSYTKPIPTPLKNPSTAMTCEKCHWQGKFSGDKPVIKTTYAPDANTTKSQFTLVLKVDGGVPQASSGIHWHSTANVWYIPADKQLNKIIWVGVEDPTSGNVTEYVDPERISELTPQLVEKNKRRMDCIDCHNRVSHLVQSPEDLIDKALTAGSIDASLPYIKKVSLDALSSGNQTAEQADAKIALIKDYYKEAYPQVYANKLSAIETAVTALKEIGRQTRLGNGVDSTTYPNNAIHYPNDVRMELDWAALSAQDSTGGCFRCHGNLLKIEGSPSAPAKTLNNSDIAAVTMRVQTTLSGIQNRSSNLKGRSIGVSQASGDTHRNSENQTTNIQEGAFGENGLSAQCNLCHYVRSAQAVVTPLAPAIPHPTRALDNCLICHSPGAARPFASTHPWATNDACKSCHEAAPDSRPMASPSAPVEAPSITHPVTNMSNCLTCHGTGGVKAVPAVHPWATNETCRACHRSALNPAAAADVPAIVPKQIPHTTTGLENCLSCHGQPTVMPFISPHPWAANNTCSICHKQSSQPKPLPDTKAVNTKEISHATSGLENCLSCHGQPTVIAFKTPHPWGTNQACGICHKPSQNPKPFSPVTAIVPTQIPHVTSGLENCLDCHGRANIMPFETPHPWNNSQACVICHKLSPGTGPAAPASKGPASTIPHSTAGLPGCTACHQTGGLAPLPANHAGRPDSFCVICHTQGTVNATTPSVLIAGPAVPHTLGGVPGCSSCHQANGAAPFPANHAGRPESFCGLCHAASASTAAPSTLIEGPAIPHPLAGLPGCTACHQTGGAAPFPVNHTGRTDSFCPICHKPAGTIVVPAAPGDLTAAVISAGQVNLTWTDTVNETGFRIERATDASFGNNMVRTGVGRDTKTFNDTTTLGNTTYYYRIFAVNSAGDSPASNTVVAATPVSSVTQPTPPSGLNAAATGPNQVNLAWTDNSNGETGFRIERASNSAFTSNLTSFNAAANTVTFSDTTASASTTYFYRVAAFNSGGISAWSNEVSLTTPNTVIDQASLYAVNCAGCHGANRQGGSASALTPAALSGVSPAQIASTINNGIGTMPAYASRLSQAQIAALSQWLKGNPPAAPFNLVASAANAGLVILTWTDPNSGNETGFQLDRSTSSNFSAAISINVTAGTTGYSDNTVSGNTAYYYRLFAVNAAGISAASNTATVMTPTSVTPPPNAPSGLSAVTAGGTNVNLTWVDNSAAETGFRIDRATNSAFTMNLTTVNAAANTVSYADTSTAGNTTYYYRVKAFNAGGISTASNTAVVTTPLPAINPAIIYASNCASCHGGNRQGGSAAALTPAALAGVGISQVTTAITNGIAAMPPYRTVLTQAEIDALAQWLKGGAALPPINFTAVAANAGQVNLSWADPNSGNETGFRIDRATDSGFLTNLITINAAAGSVVFSDATTAGNTTYYYRIFAINGAGNSGASNTAIVTTPSAAVPTPAGPSGLTAIAVNGGLVNLAWISNSTTQTGFRIDRALDNAFTNNLVSVNTGNITTYSDNTVTFNTPYYYRVYAFNAGGMSLASNTVSVTTPAASSAQLFAANCASCHGTTGQGGSAPRIAGASLPTTTYAVQGGGPTMPSFTAAQISAVQLGSMATYIAGMAPAPSDGAGLYSLNCALCHGTNGSGTAKGPSVAGVPAATLTPLAVNGLLPIMPAYPSTAINSTSMAAIANYIAGMGAPPIDGWGVYAAWCARCHGVSGAGGPNGPNVVGSGSISSVVRNGSGSMPGFSTSQISNVGLTNLQAYISGGLVPPNSPPPAAPTGLTAAVITSQTISLTWVDPNNGINETGIRLQRSTSATFSGAASFNLPAGATSYMDSNLTGGTTYYYRVQARAAVSSAYSNTVSVQLASGTKPPTSPANLVAAVFDTTRISLTWTDSVNETGFRLERARNNAFTTGLTSVLLGANEVSYNDDNVTANTTYFYRVTAFNTAGNSSPSNTASAITLPAASQSPLPAANLTGVAVSDSRVNLTWRDTSGNEAGFQIQRSTVISFGSNLLTFIVGANITSYLDTSLRENTTYFYRVIAYNSAGNAAASNTFSITTPP